MALAQASPLQDGNLAIGLAENLLDQVLAVRCRRLTLHAASALVLKLVLAVAPRQLNPGGMDPRLREDDGGSSFPVTTVIPGYDRGSICQIGL